MNSYLSITPTNLGYFWVTHPHYRWKGQECECKKTVLQGNTLSSHSIWFHDSGRWYYSWRWQGVRVNIRRNLQGRELQDKKFPCRSVPLKCLPFPFGSILADLGLLLSCDILDISLRCRVYGEYWTWFEWIPVLYYHCKSQLVSCDFMVENMMVVILINGFVQENFSFSTVAASWYS